MIYRFRAILDATDDVFRDIEIDGSASLEDFHNVLTQSFQLPGDEMASFYSSDEDWNQNEEFSLFDMSEGAIPARTMSGTTIEEVVTTEKPQLIYIYDFLSMWTFLLELADVAGPQDGVAYPQVIFSIGELPDSAPDKEFEADPRFADETGGDEEFRGDIDDGDDDFYDEQTFDDYDLY
ncbi:MAG: IS1096 element passenger TnpR family protein [Nonlabens sp.]|uniref:IS1096 element passenger TnpR family protein n=1 Tax=Nonlabens sp. TaxID=1888209 RepID=UPI003EF87D80